MNRYLFALAAVALFVTSAPASPPVRTLENANGVLDDLAAVPLKGIPPKLLTDAQCVVIVPRVLKVGFVIGARGGRGVALARDEHGKWGEPVFVQFGGASVGFQAGVESADVVLVFRTRKSLDRVLSGKDKLTLGADAAVAAGPIGRDALAATDPRLEAEVYSYSRSRGLFAGVALDGSVIQPDADENAAFAKGGADEQKWAERLKTKLSAMSSPTVEAHPLPPAAIIGPPVPPAPRTRFLPRPRVRPWWNW
jgi:lipid-binding SYLF domain-containing protein